MRGAPSIPVHDFAFFAKTVATPLSADLTAFLGSSVPSKSGKIRLACHFCVALRHFSASD